MANVQAYVDALADARKELEKIEPKYLALKDAVANLEQLITVHGGVPKPRKPKDSLILFPKFGKGTFDGLTTKPAALLVLHRMSGLRSAQIVKALESAEFHHTSKHLVNSLNTTLMRIKENEKLVERNEALEWSLTEAGKAYVENMMREQEEEMEREALFDVEDY